MTDRTVPTPLTLGPVTLRNRIVSAPMERNYGDAYGRMTDLYVDYLERRAEAGVALVFTEATFVREDGKGRRWQLGAHDDECIPGLARLVDALHAKGALVGCELNHGGRTAQSAINGHPPVAPSAVPCDVAGGEMPRALEAEEIRDLARAYGRAAARCVQAGVDVLSIHGGHGYLIHQFMSPLYNRRSDEFADPVAFLNLVIDSVRDAAPGIAVGLRFSSLEGSEGGLDADATFAIIERAHLDSLDFLDVSAGSYESGEWTIQTGEWAPGFLAEIADRYRVFGLPIGLAGRINTPEVAERVLADGVCDFVSIGRALHADPEWARSAIEGGTYRPCIACNVCIDGLALGAVACTVNPDVGTGSVPLPAPTGIDHTNILVVGGGVGGLTAARELRLAGASVTLVEREASLGGLARLAAAMNPNPEFHRLTEWLIGETARLHVQIRQATEATAESIRAEHPDAVVLATGGRAPSPSIPGLEMSHVHDIRDWLVSSLDDDPGECTIWGADTVGLGVADTLASRGWRVLVIGQQSEFAPESGRRTKILSVPRLLANPRVRIHLGVALVEVGEGRVIVEGVDARPVTLHAPGVLLVSQGTVAPDRHMSSVDSDLLLVTVGSAHGGGPSTLRGAIADATATARALTVQLASRGR
jgi:2,4-dienoyl-CoA reductase-like NADH-dependent reductase (Old Yellow Enzyme family)/thioredoxin reductase